MGHDKGRLKTQKQQRLPENPVLKRSPFLFQKLKLFRRTGTAKYGVAVRVVAEAATDGFVKFVAFGEPERAVFFGEPKIKYGLRGHV